MRIVKYSGSAKDRTGEQFRTLIIFFLSEIFKKFVNFFNFKNQSILKFKSCLIKYINKVSWFTNWKKLKIFRNLTIFCNFHNFSICKILEMRQLFQFLNKKII